METLDTQLFQYVLWWKLNLGGVSSAKKHIKIDMYKLRHTWHKIVYELLDIFKD